MSDDIASEDAFQDVYYHFNRNLRILEKDCVTQCDMAGNFNVAWGLQHELMRDGLTVLSHPASGMNNEQKALIEKLMTNLEAIPKSVFSGDKTAEGSLRDMGHPCWAPLREQASSLLKALEPATKRNIDHFCILDEVKRPRRALGWFWFALIVAAMVLIMVFRLQMEKRSR